MTTAIITETAKNKRHTFGVKGEHRSAFGVSDDFLAWQKPKPISPVLVQTALPGSDKLWEDKSHFWKSKSVALHGTTSLTSSQHHAKMERAQVVKLTLTYFSPSTHGRLRRHVLDRTRIEAYKEHTWCSIDTNWKQSLGKSLRDLIATDTSGACIPPSESYQKRNLRKVDG